jgi:hypothetical protein
MMDNMIGFLLCSGLVIYFIWIIFQLRKQDRELKELEMIEDALRDEIEMLDVELLRKIQERREENEKRNNQDS